MNIFILDRNPEKCARYHCDKHVVKMVLESAQILCSVLHMRGEDAPYRPTHISHPCVKWANASFSNFSWLVELAIQLNEEYKFRYEKRVNHKSIEVVNLCAEYRFEDIGLTPFMQCMPDRYRFQNNPVRAYRAYYKGDKRSFAAWKRRGAPSWYPVNSEN